VRPLAVVGLVLVAIGIVALAYQGISWTTQEEVAQVGPVRVTAEKEKSVPLPPIVGAVAIAGGVILLVSAWRR
jgi:hypothetical protein